jgi:asparagine synthase (glutamine-hydrolysing)
VVDFSLALGDNLKINKGVRKFILREAFKDLLPEEIYDRHDKYGFPTPQELWTRENLSYFASEILESQRVLGNEWVDFNAINAQITQPESLTKDQIFAIWRVIIFAKWVEVFEVSLESDSISTKPSFDSILEN